MGGNKHGRYRSYVLNMSGTMQIITATDWEGQLRAMEKKPETAADAAWIRGNTFHVRVDKALRVDPRTDPRALVDFVDWHRRAMRNPGANAEASTSRQKIPEQQ